MTHQVNGQPLLNIRMLLSLSVQLLLVFLDLFLVFFAFIFIGQLIDKKQSGRERGAGSGKIHKPGFKLGTPKVQWHYMLAHYPRGYRHWRQFSFCGVAYFALLALVGPLAAFWQIEAFAVGHSVRQITLTGCLTKLTSAHLEHSNKWILS